MDKTYVVVGRGIGGASGNKRVFVWSNVKAKSRKEAIVKAKYGLGAPWIPDMVFSPSQWKEAKVTGEELYYLKKYK